MRKGKKEEDRKEKDSKKRIAIKKIEEREKYPLKRKE